MGRATHSQSVDDLKTLFLGGGSGLPTKPEQVDSKVSPLFPDKAQESVTGWCAFWWRKQRQLELRNHVSRNHQRLRNHIWLWVMDGHGHHP